MPRRRRRSTRCWTRSSACCRTRSTGSSCMALLSRTRTIRATASSQRPGGGGAARKPCDWAEMLAADVPAVFLSADRVLRCVGTGPDQYGEAGRHQESITLKRRAGSNTPMGYLKVRSGACTGWCVLQPVNDAEQTPAYESFAAVDVLPECSEKDLDVELKEDRARGHLLRRRSGPARAART